RAGSGAALLASLAARPRLEGQAVFEGFEVRAHGGPQVGVDGRRAGPLEFAEFREHIRAEADGDSGRLQGAADAAFVLRVDEAEEQAHGGVPEARTGDLGDDALDLRFIERLDDYA